jgi:hypothetical protein
MFSNKKYKTVTIKNFLNFPVFDIQREIDNIHSENLYNELYDQILSHKKVFFINSPIVIKQNNKQKLFKDKFNNSVNKILIDGQHRHFVLKKLIHKENTHNDKFLRDDDITKILKQKIFIEYIYVDNYENAKNVYLSLYNQKPFTKTDYYQMSINLNKNMYNSSTTINNIIKGICDKNKKFLNTKPYVMITRKYFKKIYIEKLSSELKNNINFINYITEKEIIADDILNILNKLSNDIIEKLKKDYNKQYITDNISTNTSWIKNLKNNINEELYCFQIIDPDFYSNFINRFLLIELKKNYNDIEIL